MHINQKPTHLGHPLSKGLQRFIDDLPNPTFEKHIDGLSGEEEVLAIKVCEEEKEENEMEALMDDDSEEELETASDSYPEGYDDY